MALNVQLFCFKEKAKEVQKLELLPKRPPAAAKVGKVWTPADCKLQLEGIQHCIFWYQSDTK